jgi:hemoglobin
MSTLYKAVGGDETFWQLVSAFYRRVEEDPELRAIFPEDLEPGKEGQYLFLTQYFGGPDRYSRLKGHPRLRMRHMPFSVTPYLAGRWLDHMLEAIDEVGIEEPYRNAMREYFERSAPFMVNQPD